MCLLMSVFLATGAHNLIVRSQANTLDRKPNLIESWLTQEQNVLTTREGRNLSDQMKPRQADEKHTNSTQRL